MKTNLRNGFTTGTCMTAAAAASAIWQKSGDCPSMVKVSMPFGKQLDIEIIPFSFPETGVIKDAGDDIDQTDGMLIKASVKIEDKPGKIKFIGGEGIGTVTKPGLKIAPGEPAINPVPRQMTEENLRKIIGNLGAEVTVSAPEGKKRAEKTFNARLGVLGGISILGTSGIVHPMSQKALLDTIETEMGFVSKNLDENFRQAAFVTGGMAESFIKRRLGENFPCIQTSNYPGFALETAQKYKFKRVVLCGPLGKMVKLAGGIFNLHSHVADAKNEIICTHAAMLGADKNIIEKLYSCNTTSLAQNIIEENGLDAVWESIGRAAKRHCDALTSAEVDIIIFDKDKNCLFSSCKI